jgi:uncharacterized protein DUF1931
MPVMGFTKFERFFREAAEVHVDRSDVERYLVFVNDAIYDILVLAQATAKANGRDVILPWDPPITAGVQERMHRFTKLDADIELESILEEVAARPQLDLALADDTAARLPSLFGAISLALAEIFKIGDSELKEVHTSEWERAFRIVKVLV